MIIYIKAHLSNICIVITSANTLMMCLLVAMMSMKYRKRDRSKYIPRHTINATAVSTGYPMKLYHL